MKIIILRFKPSPLFLQKFKNTNVLYIKIRKNDSVNLKEKYLIFSIFSTGLQKLLEIVVKGISMTCP
jgi:hypothetical protein